MTGVEHRDFSAPDETRTPDKTTVELVNVAGGQIGRYTFQPGWKWSECLPAFTALASTLGHPVSRTRSPGGPSLPPVVPRPGTRGPR